VEIGPGPRVAVDDAGRGIAESDHAKLLEPFARGSTKAEGSGLGLAIVAQAVALHHAELKISRSRLGGARFAIVFSEPSAPTDPYS
jgi:signal transduction histidine kinase